ncbi:MAG: hypothetical protein ACR652_05295 [Methylocystis sp.]|uniref:hypothetical protein n=1 Tax=Methylocystis sp. TaxID=1911079 RepID=UPI003DA439B0
MTRNAPLTFGDRKLVVPLPDVSTHHTMSVTLSPTRFSMCLPLFTTRFAVRLSLVATRLTTF